MLLYKGGNGLTKEEAFIILGTKVETDGVNAEYNWLEKRFGKQNISWEMTDQEFIDEGKKQYDILRLKFPSGEIEEFCLI
jgi:hypothetical protein